MKGQRPKETWGETRNGGPGRRLQIRSYDQNATVADFQDFFADYSLEGVTLWSRSGILQFKRPSDASRALQRNQEQLLNEPIVLSLHQEEFYKKNPPITSRQLRSRTRSRSPHRRSPRRVTSKEEKRHWSYTRNRDRSLSREREESRSRTPPNRQLISIIKAPMSSNVGQFETSYHTSRKQSKPPLIFKDQQLELAIDQYNKESSFREQQKVMAQQQIQQPAQFPAIEGGQTFPGKLPPDIELTLKLLIAQNTARSLSISQIQAIINYLESEKVHLEQGVVLPRHLIVPSAQFFTSSQLDLSQVTPSKTSDHYNTNGTASSNAAPIISNQPVNNFNPSVMVSNDGRIFTESQMQQECGSQNNQQRPDMSNYLRMMKDAMSGVKRTR